jgi:hypothetical protein
MRPRLPFPRLDIEYWTNETTTFGPSALAGVIHDAASVGWAWYSRFPGAAFWTLKRDSRHNALLEPGLSHIRIWYSNEATGYGPELVFSGRLGDSDEGGDDVVWQAFGYLAELSLSRTGYRVMYERDLISSIVDKEWRRDDASGKFHNYGAKKQVKSLLAHVGTGAIQDPHNVNGGLMRTEPQFGVISVPRLLLFYDLSEISRANTTNNVTYEITREHAPEFNFWADRGSPRTGKLLTYPGNVQDFRYSRGLLNIRNDLATIGTKDGKAKFIQSERAGGAYGYDAFGRRQDTFSIKTLSGFRHLGTDAEQFSAQRMITERAVKEGTRPMRSLQLDLADLRQPFGFDPFDGWDIEDLLDVELETHSGGVIKRPFRVAGVRGKMGAAGYQQSLIVTEPVS